MEFERFDRRSRPTSTDPIMAIQKRGTFSLNAAAYAMLEKAGAPRDNNGRLHAEILYSPTEKVVGLRATAPGVATYPVRKQPKSESYLMTGRAFTVYYGIDTRKTQQYAVRDLGDGIIGFSLESDRVEE
jgi:hypothetical protein